MSLPANRQPAMFPQVGSQDTIAALCAIGRQLAMRLDELIHIMQQAEGIAPGVPRPPGVPAERAPEWIELMRMLLASYPRAGAALTVGNSAKPIAQNTSSRPIPVLVTNQDHAQILYYGEATVEAGAAATIQPKESKKIIVPESTSLYGIVEGADIQVAVSSLVIPRMYP